jgi:hypothetical protein
MPYTCPMEASGCHAVVSEGEPEYDATRTTIYERGDAVPVSILILLLGIASAWLPNFGDPRRAGEGEAKALQVCPDPDCNEPTSAAEDSEFVCEAGHAYVWDSSKKQHVPVGE